MLRSISRFLRSVSLSWAVPLLLGLLAAGAAQPAEAVADGTNQLSGIPAVQSGTLEAGTVTVTGFSFSFPLDPANDVFASGTFQAGGKEPVPVVWEIYVTGAVDGFTLHLENLDFLEIRVKFTVALGGALGAAQDQIIRALLFEQTRLSSPGDNVREWYLLSILKRLYP
jgi:hypothetical protein